MIKNERQYRITKSQAQKFQAAIRELESSQPKEGVHPLLHQAQINALRSQVKDIEGELADYEGLRDGKKQVAELGSFERLPAALIQTRIAAGLSQEQLAERLGIKPQQIQRYEATEYRSASLARVTEIVRALNVPVRQGVLPAGQQFSVSMMLNRLEGTGLSREFVKQRLLPKPATLLHLEDEPTDSDVVVEVAEGLSRIYGWSPAAVFGSEQLEIGRSASATARFKLPTRIKEAQLGAYVVYAHYLSLLVLEATAGLELKTLPQDPSEVRNQIITTYGSLTFEAALQYVWSLGIPVLPLNDPGAFHGACWRVGRRNIIVLKQRTRSVARWLHDLLHEYFHAASNADLEEHPVIEESEMSPSRRESTEEQNASQFAGDVMLDGRAEELAEECVKVAKGSVERLKSAVVRVAEKGRVQTDVLANYMAFRLSLQGINWWGAANNLQLDGSETLCTPRKLLLERLNLVQLAPIDRSLLLRALEPQVLAFSGKIGSGKSTLSAQVAKVLDWKLASFGDYVRTVTKSEGLELSREVLQDLGASLAERPEEFCRSVLAHYGWQSGEPLVIEGVRHKEILEALQRIVAPLELRVVFLKIDDEERHRRLRAEESMGTDQMTRVEAHSTEKQVSEVLPAIADLTVSADRPVGELVREIVTWVHQADGKDNRAA